MQDDGCVFLLPEKVEWVEDGGSGWFGERRVGFDCTSLIEEEGDEEGNDMMKK